MYPHIITFKITDCSIYFTGKPHSIWHFLHHVCEKTDIRHKHFGRTNISINHNWINKLTVWPVWIIVEPKVQIKVWIVHCKYQSVCTKAWIADTKIRLHFPHFYTRSFICIHAVDSKVQRIVHDNEIGGIQEDTVENDICIIHIRFRFKFLFFIIILEQRVVQEQFFRL